MLLKQIGFILNKFIHISVINVCKKRTKENKFKILEQWFDCEFSKMQI